MNGHVPHGRERTAARAGDRLVVLRRRCLGVVSALVSTPKKTMKELRSDARGSVGALVEADGFCETFRALDTRGARRRPRLIRCYRHLASRERGFAESLSATIDEMRAIDDDRLLLFRECFHTERALIISDEFDGIVLSEYLRGSEDRRAPLSARVALRLVIDVLDALRCVSKLAPVLPGASLDLGPAQIAITASGEVKFVLYPSLANVAQKYPWLAAVDEWARYHERAADGERRDLTDEAHTIRALSLFVVELVAGCSPVGSGAGKDAGEAEHGTWRDAIRRESPKLLALLERGLFGGPSTEVGELLADFSRDLRTLGSALGSPVTNAELAEAFTTSSSQASTAAVTWTGSHLSVDGHIYTSNVATVEDGVWHDEEIDAEEFLTVDAFPEEETVSSSPLGYKGVEFPGQLQSDRVDEQELRVFQAASEETRQLHYRTDEYVVLSADDGDEEAIELSSEFIRTRRPPTPVESKSVRDDEPMFPSEETDPVGLYAREKQRADNPSSGPGTRPNPPVTARPPASPPTRASAQRGRDVEVFTLEEGDIIEPDVVGESLIDEPEDTLAPWNLPSPEVDTRSSLVAGVILSDPDAPVAQAHVLRGNGECDAAMRVLESEFFGEHSLVAMFEYAQCLLENGQLEEAEERFSQLIDNRELNDRDRALARYYLALSYERGPHAMLGYRIFSRLKGSENGRFPDLDARIQRYEQRRG